MKTTEEINETLDDLTFLNRNKDYGAFQMRRQYASVLNRATAISVGLLLMALTYPLLASYYRQQRLVEADIIVNAELSDLDAPPPPEVPLPPPPPEAIAQQSRFVTPIITDDTTGDDNALNQEILAELPVRPGPGDIDLAGDSLDVPDVIDLPPAPEPILLIVDEMPEFVGGEEARRRYLHDNLNFPRVAKETGITGTVYVNFVIDAQGKVTNVTLIRGIGGGCDEEALRVVSGMPPWKPGKNGGRAVRVGFSMPIRFVLE